MYLSRKIDQFLEQWKSEPSRNPLIIRGPRQVGKTESILHFAYSNYDHVIYINFVEEPQYRMITVDGYSQDAIIKNITRIDPGKEFIPHKTLLFSMKFKNFQILPLP